MCKINGHSIFSYMFQPVTNWKKLNKSNKTTKKEEVLSDPVTNKDIMQDTASGVDNLKTEKTPITALRVPLNTQGTGSNTGNKQVGLNLLGG